MKLILATALCALPFSVAALCAEHEDITKRLAEGYGETRQSIALTSTGHVYEIYANTESGSWTTVITMPGGPSCLVATGQAYQQITEPLPPAGNEM